jgi:hypothetical protein
MNYEFLKEQLLEEHVEIDNEYYLDLYLNLVLNYEKKNKNVYSEKHHILPRSSFPKFISESWNIVDLDYKDHKLAHYYLFRAINDRRYQKPLNFMLNFKKEKKELSIAAKRGWVKLKNDEKKYKEWTSKRSDYMKSLSSDEQRRRANIFWNKITDEEYKDFCLKMQEYWTEEKREEKSIQMKKYYENEDNINRKRIEAKKRWDNLDEDQRKEFRKKMSEINKDIKKRKDASSKIKKKWKDPEYLEKMKNRRKRSGVKLKIIKNNGEIEVFESMRDLSVKYNISLYLIRKYKDKNIKIQEKYLNEENIDLLYSIIETIKN